MDFWAGYGSGAAGIIIGAPLDLLKVQKQAGFAPSWTKLVHVDQSRLRSYISLTRGSLAPVLGYGALNGLLFVAYNRGLKVLDPTVTSVTDPSGTEGWKIWLAGAMGGLASWAVSAPTELIKCRKQLGDPRGLLVHTQQIWQREGIGGIYRGGAVTSLRDAIGYGFYFWTYEKAKAVVKIRADQRAPDLQVMLCGGIAGVATWASIYPLDVIKTRVQGADLLRTLATYDMKQAPRSQLGAWNAARLVLQESGPRAFFNGLGVCSGRAFLVNGVQWYVYEAIMRLRSEERVNLNRG